MSPIHDDKDSSSKENGFEENSAHIPWVSHRKYVDPLWCEDHNKATAVQLESNTYLGRSQSLRPFVVGPGRALCRCIDSERAPPRREVHAARRTTFARRPCGVGGGASQCGPRREQTCRA